MDTNVEPIFDFVKRSLSATRGKWPDVAEGSGVAISTLRKIAQGQIEDPSISKIQALADYFHTHPPVVRSVESDGHKPKTTH